jgi:DNA-binding transcriptional MerR regulator
LSIHELATRSGVPARRIRYYIAEGLLPPPRGRGRAAHYGPEHLEGLQAIQALRRQHVGLDEIRRRLQPHDRTAGTAGARVDGALWHHWELRPGVLLLARADLGERELGRVEALVSMAQRLLGNAQEDGAQRGDRRHPR